MINIKTYNGLAVLFRRGDRVDVVVTSDRDSQKNICKNVRVFNIGTGTGTFGIVGLLVTEDQATAIADAKAGGQLGLTFRGDIEVVD